VIIILLQSFYPGCEGFSNIRKKFINFLNRKESELSRLTATSYRMNGDAYLEIYELLETEETERKISDGMIISLQIFMFNFDFSL